MSKAPEKEFRSEAKPRTELRRLEDSQNRNTIEHNFKLIETGRRPVARQTRRSAKLRASQYRDLDEMYSDDDAQAMNEYNENLSNETFLGVKQILEQKGITMDKPVIFVIKNIKSFNPSVLNDLIHMLKKYRNTYALNFCLILGV